MHAACGIDRHVFLPCHPCWLLGHRLYLSKSLYVRF
jgi:hypothetical protein